MGCFRLSPFSSSVFYKYSTASEQPGFLLFRCKRKHYFKILRKIEKIKTRHSRESNHGSPAFRASALTFRLPLKLNYIYIYIYINIQQLASNRDFSFFRANGNIILKFSGKSRKLKRATAGNRTTDLLLSGQAP